MDGSSNELCSIYLRPALKVNPIPRFAICTQRVRRLHPGGGVDLPHGFLDLREAGRRADRASRKHSEDADSGERGESGADGERTPERGFVFFGQAAPGALGEAVGQGRRGEAAGCVAEGAQRGKLHSAFRAGSEMGVEASFAPRRKPVQGAGQQVGFLGAVVHFSYSSSK